MAFGATGDGAGVGIEGETGAADGANAGVVTGSSPRAAAPSSEAEGPDDRRVPAAACLVADALWADATGAFEGSRAADAAGGADAAGAAELCSGCGAGVGDGRESAAAGAGAACAVGSEPMGSVVVLLPAWTRFQAPSPTAMMARIVAINPVVAARFSDLSWRPVMVTGSSK